VALNPLHDLHRSDPAKCSPYSPTSRRWLNTLYIDAERVPDLVESPDARGVVAALDGRLEALRASPAIDYPGVAAAKRLVLERLWHSFRTRHLERPGDARAAEFRAFVRAGGRPLEDLARYEALTRFFHDRDPRSYGWLQWPVAYRRTDSPEVERFARDRRDAVDFALYLQWLAHEQLSWAARHAQAHGVGLYCDLAVGADRNSADTWSDPLTVLPDVSLGAPPDALNALGQNWGLPPLSPYALRRQGYAPFARLLRANMQYASILRIDHVMALQRAFWIPVGWTPREGAYVEYRVDEMLAVVALESVRNRCAVVGEDLGTVPDGFRERLAAAGALSSRVLYFERNWSDGTFAAPAQYPRLAAASVGTHDLPPLPGWWTGDDLRLRQEIGLLGGTATESAWEARRRERSALIDALEREGALAPDDAAALRADAAAGGTLGHYDALRDAVYRFLAKTPSVLAIAAMEDVLGDENAVNVPGTLDEHPNWRRKHCRTLEELERDETLETIGALLRERSLT
jgi:4-alpha-glucanotransferase